MNQATKTTARVAALILVAAILSSCKIENLPGVDSVVDEISETASISMMTHLTSASQAPGNFTEDFKDGFKAGYAAGYKEAARLQHTANATCGGDCHDCDSHHDHEEIVYPKAATSGYSPTYSPPASNSYRSQSNTRSRSTSRCAGGR